MTAPDPRLSEIEARLAAATTCTSDCGAAACQTERDVAYLVAESRKRDQAEAEAYQMGYSKGYQQAWQEAKAAATVAES